jgi:hypothetical protein
MLTKTAFSMKALIRRTTCILTQAVKFDDVVALPFCVYHVNKPYAILCYTNDEYFPEKPCNKCKIK